MYKDGEIPIRTWIRCLQVAGQCWSNLAILAGSLELRRRFSIFESFHAIVHFFFQQESLSIFRYHIHFITFFFIPNPPIKPTKVIYKLFGPLHIFIVCFLFPTLANKTFLPYTIESIFLESKYFFKNTLKLACLKGKLSC